MTFEIKTAVVAVFVAGTCCIANATALLADSITANVDVTVGFFGGTLLDSAITNIANASYNGVARSAVYDTGSGLDFYYQFTNDATSKNGIERFTAYDFSSLGEFGSVNVYQTAAAFGIFNAGTEFADYADRTKLGVIGFSFVPNGFSKVNPGTTSYTQIIRTSARSYTSGNFGLLDGIGDNARGFAPAVPEPGESALMVAGLAAVSFLVARRRSQS